MRQCGVVHCGGQPASQPLLLSSCRVALDAASARSQHSFAIPTRIGELSSILLPDDELLGFARQSDLRVLLCTRTIFMLADINGFRLASIPDH